VLKTLDYLGDESGAAAAEVAMFLLLVTPILLNLADIGGWVFVRMQVENAAESAAQAAWANCTTKPASGAVTAHCPNLTPAVTGAIQGTQLGNSITWANSATIDADSGYYCPEATTKTLVAATSTTTCADTGASAGYYVKVTANYNFSPMFTGASIAALFPATITRSAWSRIE
jgi:Flp pilus assembly protein TadG